MRILSALLWVFGTNFLLYGTKLMPVQLSLEWWAVGAGQVLTGLAMMALVELSKDGGTQ